MDFPEQAFIEARNRYQALKQTCEGQVVRWEWWSHSTHNDEPYWHERHKIGRGKKLDVAPTTIDNGLTEYGFDAEGHIAVEREYSKFPGQFKERFSLGDGISRKSVLFDRRSPKDVMQIVRHKYENAQLTYTESLGRRGYSAVRYEHEGLKLTKIEITQSGYGKDSHVYTDLLEYNETGAMARITRVDQHGSEVIFQLPGPGQSIPELSTRLATRLESLIPEKIREARITDDAYCLILTFSADTVSMFPPILAVGLEKHREKWHQECGAEAKYNMWNLPKFELYNLPSLKLSDDIEVRELSRILNQQLTQQLDFDSGQALLTQVSRQLAQGDWNGVLKITDDFVVFAVDFEESDIKGNIERSCGRERLEQLINRGWI